jgi:Terpene cyclase DEP1
MKPKTLYLVLCAAGVLVPYWQFLPWVLQHGLNLPLFARELFANRIGAFFGMDVIVSAIALLVFSRIEGARQGIRRRWLVLAAVLTVGVSLGLPLFLYLREQELEHKPAVT